MGSHLCPKWLEFFFGNVAFTEFISLVFVAAIAVKEILRIYEEIDISVKCAVYYLKIVVSFIFYVLSTVPLFTVLFCLALGRYEQLSYCVL